MTFIFIHPRECACRFVRGDSCLALSFLKRRGGGVRTMYNSGSNHGASGIGRANLGPIFARKNGIIFRRTHLDLRYGGLCTSNVGSRYFLSGRSLRG